MNLSIVEARKVHMESLLQKNEENLQNTIANMQVKFNNDLELASG